MGTFSTINTALSALYASKRGLDVSGQNISNSNTPGYSRERVDFESVGGQRVAALATASSGNENGGVTVAGITRVRDFLLEQRAHSEHGRQENQLARQDTLASVEKVFGEPSDTGLASMLGEFWNGWHDVANRPGDLAARSQLLQRASTLAEGLNQTAGALDVIWSNDYDRLKAQVAEVNTTATTVAELNQAIQRSTQAGLPTSDLSDQRDLLVVRLAELVGAHVLQGQDGTVDVYVGSVGLVRGSSTMQLQVAGANRLAGVGASPVEVQWAVDGSAAGVSGGSARGLLDSLDTILPGYTAQLDNVAAALNTAVNTQHVAGYDLSGTIGGPFFAGTTATTIGVAITDPSLVAASGIAGGNLDGTNADAIAGLDKLAGGPDQLYSQTVVNLGVDTQTANRRVEIQRAVTTQVDAARDANSGVDMDEEMSNLLEFQHAYSGAARLMTAVDEMIDTLINRTGLVGR